MTEVEKMAEGINAKIDAFKTETETQKTAINEVKEALKFAATKEDLKAIEDMITDVAEDVNRQKTSKIKSVSKSKKEAVRDGLIGILRKKGVIDENGNVKKSISVDDLKGTSFNVVDKADLAMNISLTGAGVPNFPSDDANVDDNYLFQSAIDVGVARTLRRTTGVLNAIDGRMPTPIMIGQALTKTIMTDGEGRPIKVAELAKKPNMTIDVAKEKAESEKIAGCAIISEECLNRVDIIVNEILRAMQDVEGEELDEEFFNHIDSYSVPYAHNPDLVVPSPTMLDAIFAVAVSQKIANYMPTHVMLNSIDIFKLFGEKAQDGHYNLANGQSIQLLNGGSSLLFAGMTLDIIEVQSTDILAAGDFKVIDMEKIDFGLSRGFTIRFSEHLFFLQNAYVWLVEKAFASLLPSTYSAYAVVDANFDAVITDITEPTV